MHFYVRINAFCLPSTSTLDIFKSLLHLWYDLSTVQHMHPFNSIIFKLFHLNKMTVII